MKDSAVSVPLLYKEGEARGEESGQYESHTPAPQPWRSPRVLLTTIATGLVISISIITWIWHGIRGDRESREFLRFTSDGTFQLSVFEDLHFGESINDRIQRYHGCLLMVYRCMGAMGSSARHLLDQGDGTNTRCRITAARRLER